MISPRFADIQAAQGDASSLDAQSLHIHLHLPPQMTAVLMQLVTALTSQRSLFQDHFDFATQTGERSSGSAGTHTARTEPQSASVPAVTREAPDSNGETPAFAADQVETAESLLEIYRRVVKPKRQRSAGEAAIAEHESGMRAFDRFFEHWQAGERSQTGPNGMSEINLRFRQPKAFLTAPDVLSMFSKYLITVEGRAAQTVIKRITNIKIVAKALKIDVETPTPGEVKRLYSEHQKAIESASVGDRAQLVGDRAQLAGDRPQLGVGARSQTGPTRSNRRIPAWSEIDAMARWSTQAQYPYGEHAPYFWRGWIRFLSFIGPRSRDVVSVITRKDGLLKQHVIFDSVCPVEDVNNAIGSPLHSQHGWLHYPIGKDQHSENRHILFPMPLWMKNWLRFFIELSPCDRVFPSVMTKKIGWLSQKQLTAEWDKIAAAAGVDPRLVPSEGNGNRIALRKFAANWWSLQTSNVPEHQALSDKMENYVLHHVPKSTSKKHYVSDQAKLLPVMLALMAKFPLPAADAAPVSMLPE
jgi:hypothetical protein